MLSARRIDDRCWDRIPVEMRAALFAVAHVEGRDASVLDLSWNGARIRGRGLALKPGEDVDVIMLGSRDWDRRLARVIWLENNGPDQVPEAGLEFT